MRDTDGPARDSPAGRPTTAPQASHRLRMLGLVALAGQLTVLGWLALRPSAADWTSPANLTPFASVGQAMTLGPLAGLRQLADGLLPLAPLGLLLPLVCGRLRTAWLPSFLRTTGGAALLATALEILKGWAPGHLLNVDDIVLGTLGVACCHLIAVPAARALLLRDRPDRNHPHDGHDGRDTDPRERPTPAATATTTAPAPASVRTLELAASGLGQGHP
ncbi:VanZ family protein [Kitasatospora kazusensis]|uniref:VanZ family protein n=1 Tax=Kitasatospora kazusensis TaxID=407974 RepID=UPI0031E3D205